MSKQPATSAVAPVLAALATRGALDPSTFMSDAAPGVVGVLVLFGAPTAKPTPSTMRTTFDDACDRALVLASAQDTHRETANRFVASLPDVVTPVAALGLAVREAIEPGAKWVHNRTVEKASRWTYCAASVTASSVRIEGQHTCAEASPDGTLTIDTGVPADVAKRLRTAYDAARGVVEPARVSALVAAHLAKAGGISVASGAYLLPAMPSATCGVLAGLSDLGGWAVRYPVADPDQIRALTAPVVKSIDEQIAGVVADVTAFIDRAKAATKADGPTLQKRSGETIHESITEARKAAALWRDRLNLASLDVDDVLGRLESEADAADRAALKAIEKRRAAKKLAGEVARLTATDGGAQ